MALVSSFALTSRHEYRKYDSTLATKQHAEALLAALFHQVFSKVYMLTKLGSSSEQLLVKI